jgi:hypothetical protein
MTGTPRRASSSCADPGCRASAAGRPTRRSCTCGAIRCMSRGRIAPASVATGAARAWVTTGVGAVRARAARRLSVTRSSPRATQGFGRTSLVRVASGVDPGRCLPLRR